MLNTSDLVKRHSSLIIQSKDFTSFCLHVKETVNSSFSVADMLADLC